MNNKIYELSKDEFISLIRNSNILIKSMLYDMI